MRAALLATSLLFVTTLSPLALAQEGAEPTFDAAAVEAALDRVAVRSIPAAMLVIVRDGEVIFSGVDGVAEIKGAVAADAQTLFPMGALTSLLQDFVLDRLVSDQDLSLDHSVNRYLSEESRLRDLDGELVNASLRELLDGDVMFREFYQWLPDDLVKDWPLERVLREFGVANLEEGSWQPRSTVRDAVVQEVVTTVAGSWRAAIDRSVAAPFGLRKLVVDARGARPEHGAQRYAPGFLGLPSVEVNIHPAVPAAAGAWIDVGDAGRLLRGLVERAKTESKGAEGVDEVLARLAYRAFYRGMRRVPSIRLASSAGKVPGVHGSVEIFPEHGVGWMLLTNGEAANDAEAELLESLYLTLVPQPEPEEDADNQWNSAVGLGGGAGGIFNGRGGPYGRWISVVRIGGTERTLTLNVDQGRLLTLACDDDGRTPTYTWVTTKRVRGNFKNMLPVRQDVELDCELNVNFDKEADLLRGKLNVSGRYAGFEYPVVFQRR